jgi:hypothetical protein
MKPTNRNAAVLAGRGVRSYKALGAREKITTLARLYGRRDRSSDNLAPPDLLDEVAVALVGSMARSVRLFVGEHGVARANEWRRIHGPGTAMALGQHTDPAVVTWPPVPLLAVVWAGQGGMPRRLVARLARALKRAGVGFAALPHRVDQPNAWLAADVGGGS